MKPSRLVPILLLLVTACTQRVIVREFVYVDRPAAPSVQEPSGAPAADVEAVLAVARAHLGRKSVRVGGQSFRYDCSGFTTGAYSVLGIDLISLGDELNGANGVTLIHGYNERYGVNHRNLIPSPGDVAYFDNIWDKNGNGRMDYTYDLVGRLFQVHRGGVLSGQYEYDQNGNRIAEKHDDDLDGTIDRQVLSSAVIHDDQDRLIQYGVLQYTYRSSGELESRIDTVTSETTTFVYDDFGHLVSVATPNHVVEYKYDPAGRRIEKKVDAGGGSTVAYRLLWEGALRPAAMLDANNQAMATFVYGRHVNVPDYMVKGGSTYRIVTDQLGSVRLVVDASTGAVAQRIDYDAWGRVLYDSEPGFQPFGFAGGLYDVETGLVRFGARDYEPEMGRWTSKDPARFDGGDNHYVYSINNPVDMVDPAGEVANFVVGAAIGAGVDVAYQLMLNGWNWRCLDGRQIAIAAAAGAVGGGLLSKLAKATGPLKQWIRIGKSYSKTSKMKVRLSVRWGASPAGKGKYLNQIGSQRLRDMNQNIRAMKLPGRSWRVQDPGHFHIWR